MTPAPQTVFVKLLTGAVLASASSIAAPQIDLILLTGGRLNFAFVNDEGAVVELEESSTGQFSLFPENEADGSALFVDAEWEKTGTGAEARYFFNGLVDSAALRALLAGAPSLVVTAQAKFRVPSDDQDSSTRPFAITVHNNQNRAGITAPPASDFSLVVNGAGTAAELFVNGASKGWLHLQTTAP